MRAGAASPPYGPLLLVAIVFYVVFHVMANYKTPADPEEAAKETDRIIDDIDDLDETTKKVDRVRAVFQEQVENFLKFPNRQNKTCCY